MTDTAEVRCPYCNGTAMLPVARVEQIEADRDEFVVRKMMVERFWDVLCDLAVVSGRKRTTRESLRAEIKGALGSMRPFMTLPRIAGK